jgi:tripartite-type tricarboxylate transporter receptor subunit TctC
MKAISLSVISVFLWAGSVAHAAQPAADYPNRPIRFIAPFVAGGPSDILSRLLGQKLTERWGQPVIVDNRGSAGGIVGFEIGGQAAPDGYTLVLATSAGLTINPSVYRKLPYDPIRDFQPITQVTSGPYLIVVNPSVPAKSVPEYIELAKAKPGYLNFAATGTNNLLAMELFNHMAGIKTVAINYKGTGQAVGALVSGEVHAFIINPLVGLPQVEGRKAAGAGRDKRKTQSGFSGPSCHRRNIAGLRADRLALCHRPEQDAQADRREAFAGADQHSAHAGDPGALLEPGAGSRGIDTGRGECAHQEGDRHVCQSGEADRLRTSIRVRAAHACRAVALESGEGA